MNKNWLILLGLAVAAVVTFSNSLHNPFMMDDHVFFSERKSSLALLYQEFIPDRHRYFHIEGAPPDTAYYRPVAHAILALCCAVFHNDPFGYHMFNLMLLWGAGGAIYVFLKKIFGHRLLAGLTALLYIIHPLNGVLVNYITASVFSAQVIFMLASLFCLWETCRRKDTRTPGAKSVAAACPLPLISYLLPLLSVLFFLLALMCHESALFLPLYGMALLGIARCGSLGKIVRGSGVLWIACGLYILFRLKFASLQGHLWQNLLLLHAGPMEFIASLSKLTFWYLTRFVNPQGIVLMWATPVVRGGAVWGWGLGLAVLAAAWWAVFRMSRDAAVRLGMIWFAVGMIPLALGSVVSPLQGVMIEPHWFVFSSIGFFLALVSCLVRLKEKIPANVWIAGVAAVAVVWTGTSRAYNVLWSDEKTYCQYWKGQAPGFKTVDFFLAQVYEDERRFDVARRYYQQSLLDRYKDWKIYASLGRLDLLEGRWEEAKKDFGKALSIEPHAVESLNGIGYAFFKERRMDIAKKFFMLAIAENRYATMGRSNLAGVLMWEGRVDDAIRLYEENLKYVPYHEPSLVALAKIYFDRRDSGHAVAVVREMAAHSTRPMTLVNSGILLSFYHLPKEALEAFRKSIALAPSYGDAYVEAGKVYRQLHDDDAALRIWQQGMAVNPKDRRLPALIDSLVTAAPTPQVR